MFDKSKLSYADVAHELGCTELTARNKINGKTKINRAEEYVLIKVLKGETICTIEEHKN